MTAEVIQFVPRPNMNRPSMEEYYRDCALTGDPVSPLKMTANTPGAYVTADGDIFYGDPDTAPSDYNAPSDDCA